HEELWASLSPLDAQVNGGIVMVGAPPNVPVNFNERPKRTPDDQAKARYQPDPNAPEGVRGGRGGGPGGPGGGRGGRGAQTPPPEGHLSAQQVNQRIAAFLREN